MYLHHSCLCEGTVRVLDDPDGGEVVEHPALALEEGGLVLHQLDLKVLVSILFLQYTKGLLVIYLSLFM